MIDDSAAGVLPFHLVVARGYGDDIHPGSRDLVLDGSAGTVANRDHRQHRTDADGDPEKRQGRSQAVSPERSPCQREAR
jgi:hypothetical protein